MDDFKGRHFEGQGRSKRLTVVRDKVGEPVLVPVAETLERRLEAIAAYRSQVPVIFRFTNDFRGAVTEFANRVGQCLGPAERFWPILH